MTYQIWKDVRDEVLRKMERYKSEERSNFEELVDTAIWLEEHKDEDSDDYSTMRRLETFLIVHRTSSVDDYFDERYLVGRNFYYGVNTLVPMVGSLEDLKESEEHSGYALMEWFMKYNRWRFGLDGCKWYEKVTIKPWLENNER